MRLQNQLLQRSIKRNDPEAFAPERVVKMVSQFERQIDRIMRLVEDMLDISRIATGRLTITRERMDLCELAKELGDRFGHLFREQGADLTVSCEGKVEGSWDHFRIEQVVSNLLTNALRYAPGAKVALTVTAEGGMAALTVKDSGPGILPEIQERIFQKFERGTASANQSGLGLGLFIVRSIVEMHEGSVGVESEPGKGAAFTVRLPLA